MFSSSSGTSAEIATARSARAASATVPHSDQRRSQRLVAGYLFVVLATAALLATQIAAQQPAGGGYATIPIPQGMDTPNAVRLMEQARRKMPTEPSPDKNSNEYRYFEAYYTRYIFAKMTQPDARGELGKIIQDIQKDLDRAVRSGTPAAADMRGWILQRGGALAAGANYDPAVRVAATLLIGQLDDKVADNAGNPPVPSDAAFRGLIFLYEKANNDGVRAAALQGLHRHIRYGFYTKKQPELDAVATLMFQLAQSDPPAGRDPAAHAFLQRYAVDILTVLNNQQRSPQVTQTLVSLSSSPTASPVISLYAAEMLGRVPPQELTPIQQAQQVVGAWAAKAADAFEAEADRLASLEPPKAVPDQPQLIDPNAARTPAGGYGGGYGAYGGSSDTAYDPGGYSGGDYGGSGGYAESDMYAGGGYGGYGGMLNTTPQPPEVIASRRRVNAALQALQLGLTGSGKQEAPKQPRGLSAKPETKATADQLVAAILSSAEALNDATLTTEQTFMEMLREQAAELRLLADTLAPPAADPAAPAADDPAAPAAPAEPAPAATPDVAALGAAN